MTKDQFRAKYRDVLAGMLLDATVSQRHGPELAIALRAALARLDGILEQQWHDMQPKPVPANGVKKP